MIIFYSVTAVSLCDSSIVALFSHLYLYTEDWPDNDPGGSYDKQRFKEIFGHRYRAFGLSKKFPGTKMSPEMQATLLRCQCFEPQFRNFSLKMDVLPFRDSSCRVLAGGKFQLMGVDIPLETVSMVLHRPGDLMAWEEGDSLARTCSNRDCLADGHVIKEEKDESRKKCIRSEKECRHDPVCIRDGLNP